MSPDQRMMVNGNGQHLYSAFIDPMATKALHFASHSLIHTPTGVSAMQGAIQLIGSSWGLAHGHLDAWSGGTGD